MPLLTWAIATEPLPCPTSHDPSDCLLPVGDDLQSPFLGNAALEIDEEVLERRSTQAVLSWLEEDCSPGVPHRVARKLLDDGRQVSWGGKLGHAGGGGRKFGRG